MNNLIIRNRPYSLSQDFDRIFDSLFSLGETSLAGTRSISVDVRETDEGYVMEAELPGFSEDQVQIRVEDNLLVIESNKEEKAESTKEEGKNRWLIRERSARTFRRSFALPKDVDQEGISAVFSNGLLTLTLPRSEKAKPRSIEIRRA